MANKESRFPIVSMSRLARTSNIDYRVIVNNVTGRYTGLDEHQKTTLANAAHKDLVAFFDFLGFKISIERKG